MGKSVKMSFEASKKLANGQNIDYSEKRKRPKGFICPCTGVKYHNIQRCLFIYAADSGERLQDHWSSGWLFSSTTKKTCIHVCLPMLTSGRVCLLQISAGSVFVAIGS